MSFSILGFIERTANNFAPAIKAGRFDCSSSFKTDENGMKQALENSTSISQAIIGKTATVMGIKLISDWKKKIENRDVCLEVTCEGKDKYQICVKLCLRKEVKEKGKAKDVKCFEPCAYCDKKCEIADLKKCGGCKAVRYCSPECAKQDWKQGHKQACVKCA
jgi:hypothetical protein